MTFEWDDNKNVSNKMKHGISFEEAKRLWNDPFRVEIQISFPDEDRSILIGRMDNKIWTAVFTFREDSIRIISVRRARKKEASLYGSEQDS
ncbi:MAG: BrnT family toxin [Proteobacteria bacterium]|nr:BrnT family toxin [Pseudomonadota bacterium]